MVVAQAQKIEVAGDRVTFTLPPAQRALRDKFEQKRAWLESIAQQHRRPQDRMVSARPTRRRAAAAGSAAGGDGARQQSADKKSALREQALADAGVQAMLEVFPAEIRDVEEM